MVVTIDLLDDDIHPANKMDVGERLAAWALAKTHHKRVPYSGPFFDRAEIANGEVTIHFTGADSGLMVATKEGQAPAKERPREQLRHFELADESGQWHSADATIQGRTVIVRKRGLPAPVAVRYAYAVNPQHCNLFNRDGLPASPFCSAPELLQYVPNLPPN